MTSSCPTTSLDHPLLLDEWLAHRPGWNGGISFGGVISFIFADLIIVPILIIYRKYYGTKMAMFIAATFYATIVLAGYAIEVLFGAARLVPTQRHAKVMEASITWDYTTVLNIIFILVALGLIVRFVRSGGVPMLKMMNGAPQGGDHDHG